MADNKPVKKTPFAKPAWLTKQTALNSTSSTASKSHQTPPPQTNLSASTSKSPVTAQSSGDDNDAGNLFRRGKDMQVKILAQQEERERRKAQRRREKEQARLKQQQEIEQLEQQSARETTEISDSPIREHKRRRISDDTDAPTAPTAISRKSTTVDEDDSDLIILAERTVTPEPTTQASSRSPPAEASFELNDGEEDDEIQFEDPILVARARAQKLERDLQARSSSTTQDNPALDIFITSKIPGTKPLLVKRRYLQSLEQVRLAWCKYNALPASNFFLTYRGRKVYDVQTLQTLKVKFTFDSNGNPTVVHDEEEDILENLGEEWEETSGGVHFIVSTKEIEEEEAKMASLKDQKSEEQQEEAIPEEKEERKFKVILKSNLREIDDMRLILKTTTTIQTIIDKYRKQVGILPESSIAITFDGEQLDPTKSVGDTEIAEVEDGEIVTLDVYIR